MENSNASASELWSSTDSEDGFVDYSGDKSHGARNKKGKDAKSSCDSEDLSDIKDAEVDSYINNEKQMNYKKIIWEMMNRKYLKDQEAKKKLAASNLPNPKKKQHKKPVKDGKKAAETNKSTASKKRPSARVNYDALQKMFEEEEPVPPESTKRARKEPEPAKAQADDSELDEYDENEEDDEWEENQNRPQYNDQDEDYYYDDGEDLF